MVVFLLPDWRSRTAAIAIDSVVVVLVCSPSETEGADDNGLISIHDARRASVAAKVMYTGAGRLHDECVFSFDEPS